MRRRIWLVGGGALTLAVGFAFWLPGYRLERELAAARSEGLWTEAADVRCAIQAVPPEENAAEPVRAAIARARARRPDGWEAKAVGRLLRGIATPDQSAEAKVYLTANQDLASLWHTAAERPRLAFDRPWEEGFVFGSEYPEMRNGVQFLVASARVGLEPGANLRAAARLAALAAQEPGLSPSLMSAVCGTIALREAKREGRAREIEALLGPPIDARRIVNSDFYGTVQTMRRVGQNDERLLSDSDRGWKNRLRRMGPWRDDTIRRVVALYRDLWRAMPEDGSDYSAIVRAYERKMPAVEAATDAFYDMSVLRSDLARAIPTFQAYEADREAARR